MPVRLARTEAALTDCRDHLAAVASADPDIDVSAVSAYLAVQVAIILCAEVEASVRGYFAEIVEDSNSTGWVKEWAQPRLNDIRNATFASIVDLLNWRMDRDVADSFVQSAEAAGLDDAAKSRLGNVVKARNDTSHASGARVTFGEVEVAARVAVTMLEAARSAMGLPVV